MSSESKSPSPSPLVIPSHLHNFIGGEFLPPTDGQYIDNYNPSSNTLLCKIPRSSSQDVDKAVKAAQSAYPAWSSLGFPARSKFLKKIADSLASRLTEMARIESADTGKPLALALLVDIPRAVSNFEFFSTALIHDAVECHHMDDAINYTQRSSIGVAGLITPWNLPIYLLSWKVAPCLLMGNTIVAKPSELTPLTAHFLGEICKDAGLPPGVLNIVHGYGHEVGQSIIEHTSIPLISFTGGTVTGRRVASTCAPLFKKLSLELGGKNSTIVCNDADLSITVPGVVRASFANQGQICLCGSRLLIQSGVYKQFMSLFLEEVKKLVPGDPSTANYGSLSSLAHRDKIESYVEIARKDGGLILCGGKRPTHLPPPFDQGAYYEPTVIEGLPVTHRCSVEEIFGPVIVVHQFDRVDEAIQIANNTKYGLAGSLWCRDINNINKITKQWETGMIWVNCWLHRDLRVPFGGIKESGLGIEGGKHSLEFYSNTKNVCIHSGPSKL